MRAAVIILTLFIGLFSYPADGQNVSVNSENSLQPVYYDEVPVAHFVGNNFSEMRNQFRDGWNTGDIVLTNGKVIKNLIIRYNNYQNELAWMRGTDYKMGILLNESIKEFTIYPKNGSQKQVFRKVHISKILTEIDGDYFAQVLAEGKINLICLRKINKVGSLGEYSETDHYYLLRNDVFSRLFLQKNALLSLFDAEEKYEIKSIIRSNHFHVRKEKDMIKVVEILNEKSF